MIKLRPVLTFLSLLLLFIPIADAGENGLKLVTATGRAAIISNEQIHKSMSKESKKKFNELFSISSCVDQYLDLISKIKL